LSNRSLLTRRTVLLVALALMLLAAACGPAPLGTSWPAVSLIQTSCNDQTSTSILVAYNEFIVQVNPADGKGTVLLDPQDCQPRSDENGNPLVWQYKVDGAARQFFSLPVQYQVDGKDQFLAISWDQHIYEINASAPRSTGAEGTTIAGRTGHTVADLVMDDQRIYIGLNSKDVVALDRDTFDVVWAFTTEHGVWSKPLLDNGTLYISSLDHFLYAVDAASGDLQWKLDLNGAVTATPVLHNGRLYISSFARKVFEVSLAGEITKDYATDDWVWGSPSIVGDILYIGDLGGSVYALDTTNGLSEVWKRSKLAAGAIRATPLVYEDRVLVAARDQKVYWLNRDDGSSIIDSEGAPLVRELPAQILSDLLLIRPEDQVDIAEPYVVVTTLSTGQLMAAYTLDNGENKWLYAFQ
jgi:outer membrane protein assembly factor BamB